MLSAKGLTLWVLASFNSLITSLMPGVWPASWPTEGRSWLTGFREARGEAGEVASHLERLYRYELLGKEETAELLTLANRVCAMLTGLIRHCSR